MASIINKREIEIYYYKKNEKDDEKYLKKMRRKQKFKLKNYNVRNLTQ